MRQAKVTVAIFLLTSFLARADSLNLALFQSHTDNLFQTYFAEKDQISSLSFALEKELKPFSLFSEGSYSYLYQNTNVSYYTQDIGIDYVHPLSRESALYLAIKAGGAIYRADYADFNFLSVEATASTKAYLTQTSIFKATYAFDYKNYRNELFDFVSHLGSLSVDKYLQTQTTLKAELNWGYKYFLHPFELLENGSTAGNSSPPGGKRRGPGHHFSSTNFAKAISVSQEKGQGLQILSLSGLLAQGLGQRIGLRISGIKQWTLSGENPFVSVEEYYLVENPTYDVFAWNGTGFGTELTIESPWNTEMKIGYTKMSREFPGIDALDLDGNPLAEIRQDKRNQWEARLEKNFPALSIYISYNYVDNTSTDPLFKWHGHFLSAGISWNVTRGSVR